MKITVKVFKISKEGNMKATASITLDDWLVVKGFKVLNGKNGLFISFPNKKDLKGEYKDEVFSLNKEKRDMLQSLIMAEYNGEKVDGNITNDEIEEEFPF